MRRLDTSKNTSHFMPDFMATSVSDIDFELLAKVGITHIAFDVDSTLVNFRDTSLSAKTKQLLISKRHLFKQWCIASNRVVNNLEPLAKVIDADIIETTLTVRKPQRRYFQKVIKHFNADARNIAMVGDKLLADIWGANRAGLTTVWVEHLGPDSPWDKVYRTRTFERWVSKRYTKERAKKSRTGS